MDRERVIKCIACGKVVKINNDKGDPKTYRCAKCRKRGNNG